MDYKRYHRQILVPELGKSGQKLLSKKHAVIIGGGGLGSNSSEILVRLGIGHTDIVYNPYLLRFLMTKVITPYATSWELMSITISLR